MITHVFINSTSRIHTFGNCPSFTMELDHLITWLDATSTAQWLHISLPWCSWEGGVLIWDTPKFVSLVFSSMKTPQYIKLTSWIINLLKAERCRQGQQHSPTHGFSEQFVWEVTATWSYPTNTCWVWLTIHTPESNTLRAISCSQPQHTTICNKVEWGRQITCPTM